MERLYLDGKVIIWEICGLDPGNADPLVLLEHIFFFL